MAGSRWAGVNEVGQFGHVRQSEVLGQAWTWLAIKDLAA
jgi:hypothetical protein